VPAQAAHLTSLATSFGLGLSMKFIPEMRKGIHIKFGGTRSTFAMSL
jgi:hypothetical protein